MNQQELRQLIDQAAAEKWTELDLHGQELTELPPEIGLLTNLTSLNLLNNELKAVPPEIGQLTNLTSLDLSFNRLTAVPPEIWQLTSLTSLGLNGTQLTAVPPKIGQLTNLTSLDLVGTRLTAVPPEIGQLTNLTKLDLSLSQLTAVPPEFWQLTNLTSLNLWRNQLTAVPPEIGQLSNLTSLNLRNNKLTAVPPEIGELTNLTTLNLWGNQLTAVPPEIGQLSNLTSLNLRYNKLTAVPPEIGQLTNLTTLNLDNNPLTTVPPEIGQLTNLTWLVLSDNQLTAVPPEIGQLTNLTVLLLGGNQLTAVPPEIGQLTDLTEIDLSDNRLKRLPEALQQLTKLEYLDLRDNPALGISPEVLEEVKNPALILRTYFGARRPLHEAKLLLVGQGGVGKTALARRLLHNLPPDEAQGKTAGVDIQKWDFPLANAAAPITLNLWDFGGQGVYQATHQFFFTSRSLYLVVINARTGEQESRLRHWLKLVASLSDNAPVIIVINKQDEHPLALDERELKHKYPNLLHVVATSCTNGAGIDELRQAIASALAALPGLNDAFPIPWFALKKQLETMDATYITYERYAEICREAGIASPADQRSWVQVLHQLGVVLNYQDDNYRHLEGTHVLKPDWVTDGVYRILSDPDGRIAANNGILTAAMLDHILDPAVYPRHQQHFIVEMMRKFELSFRIPDRSEKYLIPDLLPKERPSKFENNSPELVEPVETSSLGETSSLRQAQASLPQNAPELVEPVETNGLGETNGLRQAQLLNFEIHYTDFLPDSILPRFMVNMMVALDRKVSWRSGAVLKFDGNTALIRADLDARSLFISINGTEATRRGLLNSIRMQLHAIHSTFPNLPLTEHIPIPGQPDKTIAYHALCNLEAKGIAHYYDPVNDVELDVKALLAGIETPALRRERQLQESLLKAYNLDGLMQLCFDLDVDYEDLPGQTLSAKTRELVQALGRRNRLDALEAKLRNR